MSAITSTEPIQKLLISMPPRLRWISGSSVENTTPPAKMPTAIFDTMKVMSDTMDRT